MERGNVGDGERLGEAFLVFPVMTAGDSHIIGVSDTFGRPRCAVLTKCKGGFRQVADRSRQADVVRKGTPHFEAFRCFSFFSKPL